MLFEYLLGGGCEGQPLREEVVSFFALSVSAENNTARVKLQKLTRSLEKVVLMLPFTCYTS